MQSNQKHILIVDDHQIIGELISLLAKTESDIGQVEYTTNIVEAKNALKKKHFDLAIVDLTLEGESGLSLIDFIKEKYTQTKVMVFSMHLTSYLVTESLTKGVDGYVPKSSSLEEFKVALKAIFKGERYVNNMVTESLISGLSDLQREKELDGRATKLTSRENEILQEVLKGNNNKEISGKLHISLRTVENHRANILRKMNVSNFYELSHLKKV